MTFLVQEALGKSEWPHYNKTMFSGLKEEGGDKIGRASWPDSESTEYLIETESQVTALETSVTVRWLLPFWP